LSFWNSSSPIVPISLHTWKLLYTLLSSQPHTWQSQLHIYCKQTHYVRPWPNIVNSKNKLIIADFCKICTPFFDIATSATCFRPLPDNVSRSFVPLLAGVSSVRWADLVFNIASSKTCARHSFAVLRIGSCQAMVSFWFRESAATVDPLLRYLQS
jgi:hypothetical protein